MISFSVNSIQAVEWTTALTAIYILLDSAEKLFSFREFLDSGLLSWNFLRENLFFKARSNLVRKLYDTFFGGFVWLFLLFLRGIISLYLLVFTPNSQLIEIVAFGLLFIIGSLANLRNAPFGGETENRFSLMILGALFLRSIIPTELVTVLALWFIALQSCLSYLTAGLTKLFNKDWREGNGLFHIMNSPNLVASPKMAFFFVEYRRLDKVLNWLSVGVECLFPLVFVVGKPFFILFLLWGFTFHLLNAIFLRLNKFFWIWIATYPAIIFAAQ